MENVIFNQDCIKGLEQIPSNSVDFVLTDPPFGINFNGMSSAYKRKKEFVVDDYFEIDKDNYYQFSYSWLYQCKRVLKLSGSMMVISGWNNLKDVLNAISDLDLEIINHIIWKFQFGLVTKTKFVSSHYHCLYISFKNNKKRHFNKNAFFNDDEKYANGNSKRYRDMEDVWIIQKKYVKMKIKTPTVLPEELVKKILLYCTKENDLILDPFLGSGQVAITAFKNNRRYLGFEISPKLFKNIENRFYEIKRK